MVFRRYEKHRGIQMYFADDGDVTIYTATVNGNELGFNTEDSLNAEADLRLAIDRELEKLQALQPHPDGGDNDYILKSGYSSVWIQVDGYVVWVRRLPSGHVVVEISTADNPDNVINTAGS